MSATQPLPTSPPPLPSLMAATPAHPAPLAATTGPTDPKPNIMDPTTPLPDPILTTPRLIIRPMHPQDAPSLARVCAPPSITKYMTYAFAYPYTLQHAETWIETNLTGEPKPLHFFIFMRGDDADSERTVIGGIGIKPGADVQGHVAELGYWLGEEWWGKGIMREAVEAFVEWCFEAGERSDGPYEWGRGRWKKLWAGVCGGNVASMSLLKRCGFQEEGVQRGQVEKWGEVRDMHNFGLLKGEWEERRRREREGRKEEQKVE